MPGSTFRLCVQCQARMWVAWGECRKCGAQQPILVPSEREQRTIQRPFNPEQFDKAGGLLLALLMMAEKREGCAFNFSSAPNPESKRLFAHEPKPLFTKKGKPLIAPATFTQDPGHDGCSSFEDTPWRQVDWSEGNNRALMDAIRSYRPPSDSAHAARVLLVGPVGAGKSSFINSIQSVFYGRVVNRAMVGTSLSVTASFTKQLQSFQLYGSRETDEDLAVVLSDIKGLEETNGLTLHDTLAVIKGHIPEGHKFSTCCPLVSDTPGYVKEPSAADRVHCVVFVVSGQEISSYSENMKSIFHQLREHISALGVQQMAVLTHVDKVCSNTASDISQVYNGSLLRDAMLRVSDLLGMPLSSIIPVKNYSEELELDPHTDTLLLKALEHILLNVDLHLRDHPDTGRADSPISVS